MSNGRVPPLKAEADWILVAEVDGRIAGYAVWKKASALEVKHSFDVAHCNLEAIHPDFFGRGLYTALAFEGMRIGGTLHTLRRASTRQQLSSPSRSLKLGWKITGIRHSFHKWLSRIVRNAVCNLRNR